MEQGAEVIEYTDPGCSWAWGAEGRLRLLWWRYGHAVRWRRVLGGLVGDLANYLGEYDPVAVAPGFADYWRGVSTHTGMPYPARLQWMYASTEPAGIAVKAAHRQGEAVAGRVLRRLREATFVDGRPPDTAERIGAAVAGVPGLDSTALLRDCERSEVRAAFRADWAETRDPNDDVRSLVDDREGGGAARESEGHLRYVFPTVIMRGPGGERTVAGWQPPTAYAEALAAVAPDAVRAPRPDPSPAEVFATWPTAAPAELRLLCGDDAVPPGGTVRVDTGGGAFWLTEVEAARRGLVA
jgi:protein-disulfide isomerase-like protein with CxxC motif